MAGGIGLVTPGEFRKRKERMELTIAEEEEKMLQQQMGVVKKEQRLKETGQKRMHSMLSFGDEEGEE